MFISQQVSYNEIGEAKEADKVTMQAEHAAGEGAGDAADTSSEESSV